MHVGGSQQQQGEHLGCASCMWNHFSCAIQGIAWCRFLSTVGRDTPFKYPKTLADERGVVPGRDALNTGKDTPLQK